MGQRLRFFIYKEAGDDLSDHLDIHIITSYSATTIHARSVDEPPSIMVSSGGLETALMYAGRLMCFSRRRTRSAHHNLE